MVGWYLIDTWYPKCPYLTGSTQRNCGSKSRCSGTVVVCLRVRVREKDRKPSEEEPRNVGDRELFFNYFELKIHRNFIILNGLQNNSSDAYQSAKGHSTKMSYESNKRRSRFIRTLFALSKNPTSIL